MSFQLRYDAKKTLEVLNQATFSGDPFVEVFLRDSRDLATRFDVILRYFDVFFSTILADNSI